MEDKNKTPTREDAPDWDEFLDTPEQEKLLHEESERTARNLLRLMEIEADEKSLKDIVFSLEMTKADNNARNPIDFADMLSVNARVLNAAFEFYLSKAHKSAEPDQKIKLAFAAQSLLVRSIGCWKRLSDMQIGGTK